MSATAAGSWFAPTAPLAKPEVRLFCLHHAGAGASAFRGWQELVGPRIEVIPVQLPGREARFTEPAERSLAALADRLVEPVGERAGSVPFAFFGHSMGALLGYDLTRRLTALGRPPLLLGASGCVAPQLQSRKDDVHGLSDEGFLQHIRKLEGTPAQILDNPSLRDLVLPVLRDDFIACETYVYEPQAPLRTAITVLGGDTDPGVPADQLARWGDLTEARTTVRIFPGGHFYLADQLGTVVSTLVAELFAELGTAVVPTGS
ncbi:thioesterase II family protein [Streptomyces sp. NBC_01304]|uniref:thioesterase II family protein n=1 Tax=Streptomyces sp. NBC_01304 TaxID=2903818 RepID=UPI002E119768|nr:alpha/beta fold hydrolase [Streptomyces sp. NBC_01304]